MSSRFTNNVRPRARHACSAGLVLAALAAQVGCGREFFRHWADQDVSEAVFEKSRHPRWRLDTFSVEPPAMSRFADPYDPDRPPAPPDDHATQALGPVPQWPDHRLITPAEGTGYIEMLEQFQREGAQGDKFVPEGANQPERVPSGPGGVSSFRGEPTDVPSPPPANSISPTTGRPETTPPSELPPLPSNSSPFTPRSAPVDPPGGPQPPPPNPGTGGAAMTPKTLRGRVAPTQTAAAPATPGGQIPPSQARPMLDAGVQQAAMQQLPAPQPGQPGTGGLPATAPGGVGSGNPLPLSGDPSPGDDRTLKERVNPRPDQTPEQYKAAQAATSELSGLLIPATIDFNEAEAAALERDSKPYVITMEQAFRLALVNARVYQYQLENVYAAALAVTLQRFAFQPQLFAGLSPTTLPAGPAVPTATSAGLTVNPINSFVYKTRATGAQASTLSIGQVAGIGKAFSSGAHILASFATQLVFNFVGKNPIQPSVNSYLPLTFVQPFLRGGGRAVTLEPLSQAERNLVYAVRSFAKFRQEFLVTTLVGGMNITFGTTAQVQGFTGGGNTDPVIGFINVVEDIQLLENNRKNLAAFEQLYKVYEELIKGEPSGLTQLQLDQVDSFVQQARTTFIQSRLQYRNDLDQFKIQLGLPPDTPLLVERSLTARFKQVFEAIDEWTRRAGRDLADLPEIAAGLPALEDILIDGRSMHEAFDWKDPRTNLYTEDKLSDILIASERVALENRLDIMNARAQLYDFWRQLRVTANALRGVFNLAITNSFVTPTTTTNAFAFLEQAKQFQLVINAELPLIRVAERNAFRAAWINYQRQRRSLMAAEDQLKYQLRQEIRQLQTFYLVYGIQRKNFLLQVRIKDQAFETIIAPPAGGAGAAANAQGAVQTQNLTQAQGSLVLAENALVTTWYNYQTIRLQVYRDLGTLPIDEWEAFYEVYPTNAVLPARGGFVPGRDRASGAAAAPRPAGPAPAAAPEAGAPGR